MIFLEMSFLLGDCFLGLKKEYIMTILLVGREVLLLSRVQDASSKELV